MEINYLQDMTRFYSYDHAKRSNGKFYGKKIG